MPDIFQLGFMVRAFIAGGLVGFVCPLLGTFLVLRRLSLIADTLAHVALVGAAVGLFFSRSPLVIALGVSAGAALALEWSRSSLRFAEDTSLALILYSALAVTLVIVSLGNGLSVDLFGYLFGNIVTARQSDLWAIGGLSAAVLLALGLLYTELVQTTFDPVLARVSGVAVGRVNILLAVLTGMTVTLSMRVVGALLVGALIVFPTVAALQLGRGFRPTLLSSALLGLLCVVVGLTVSYYWDIAPGGAIVLSAAAVLVTVLAGKALTRAVTRGHGALSDAPPAAHEEGRVDAPRRDLAP